MRPIGFKHTEETKAKMRKPRAPFSEETKAKMRERWIERRKIPVSKETRLKQSIARLGKKRQPFSDIHRKHLSESYKPHKHSEEVKDKIRRSNLGHSPWHKGKTKVYSTNTLIKMSNARIEYMKTHSGKFIDTKPEKKIEQELIKRNIDYIHPFKVNGVRHLADFFLPEFNVIIECDGIYWHSMPSRKERDKEQTQEMILLGYNVCRFTDYEILNFPNDCLDFAIGV